MFCCSLNCKCAWLLDLLYYTLCDITCRLSKLRILELRENHLKTLPQSISRLSVLERLDVGCNEFTELVMPHLILKTNSISVGSIHALGRPI